MPYCREAILGEVFRTRPDPRKFWSSCGQLKRHLSGFSVAATFLRHHKIGCLLVPSEMIVAALGGRSRLRWDPFWATPSTEATMGPGGGTGGDRVSRRAAPGEVRRMTSMRACARRNRREPQNPGSILAVAKLDAAFVATSADDSARIQRKTLPNRLGTLLAAAGLKPATR